MSDLTAFPMDSQVTGMGDDGLPVYDRAFDSTDLREVYKTYFSNGYFAEIGTSMHVKAASGMTATVEAGKVNIQGTLGFMTEDATVTFAAAGNASRVDTVVARLDLSVEKRVIELDVLKGEEGVTTAPSLTRDSTVWELGLADVTVPANTAAIKDENIGDTRLDTTRCGVVNPFAKLDTDSLFTQVTAIINKASDDTTANIERLESEVDAAITAADAALAADTAKLDKATADAVSAMNDALSSTVLGSVWRLGSSSAADYLAYGDDLNDIASVCTKFCESTSIAGGIANKPADVTGAFVVHTFATEQDPSRLGQMLLEVGASGVSQFFRSGAGSSWTDWLVSDHAARDAAAEAQAAAETRATADSYGIVKVGDGLSVSGGTVSALPNVEVYDVGEVNLASGETFSFSTPTGLAGLVTASCRCLVTLGSSVLYIGASGSFSGVYGDHAWLTINAIAFEDSVCYGGRFEFRLTETGDTVTFTFSDLRIIKLTGSTYTKVTPSSAKLEHLEIMYRTH